MKTALCALLLSFAVWAEPGPQFLCPTEAEPLTGFSPSGNRLYLQLAHLVRVFDLTNMKQVGTFGPFQRPLGVALNAGGSLLAVGDYPLKVYAYDCSRPGPIWTFHGPAALKSSYDLQFSPRSDLLLCNGDSHGPGSLDPLTRLFDGKTGRLLFSWNWLLDSHMNSEVSWSPAGDCIVRAGKDKLQSYSPQTGRQQAEVRLGGEAIHLFPHALGVQVRHQDASGAECVEAVYATPGLKQLQLRPDFESDTVQSPDGQLSWKREQDQFIVVNPQGLAIYSGPNEERLAHWTRHGFVIMKTEQATCYAGDGRLLGQVSRHLYTDSHSDFALEVVGYGGPCQVYDLGTGKVLGKFAYAAGPSYSADGKKVALCTPKGVLVLDIPQCLQEQKLVAYHR